MFRYFQRWMRTSKLDKIQENVYQRTKMVIIEKEHTAGNRYWHADRVNNLGAGHTGAELKYS